MTKPMGLLGGGFDFSQVAEDEFNDWYDTEHIPERLRIKGFINAVRWIGAENPKGELGFYICSKGGGVPYRLKIRAPSFANLQSMGPTLEGRAMFADIVAAIGSIDIILGEVDR